MFNYPFRLLLTLTHQAIVYKRAKNKSLQAEHVYREKKIKQLEQKHKYQPEQTDLTAGQACLSEVESGL